MSRKPTKATSSKAGKSSKNMDNSKVHANDSKVRSECSTDELESKGSNDVAWYAKDPQLLLDAARINFSQPFGAILDASSYPSYGGVLPSSGYYEQYGVIGTVSLHCASNFGYARDKSDPLNIAANALYTQVRYVNSGRKNYDPADLMLYCMAFSEMYSFLYWMQRLYNYAFMYSQRNWFACRELIKENNVDPDILVRELPNLRYMINVWINKITSFAVPADIDYFRRKAFLYQNYYIENGDGNIKDQIYQLVPDGFYKFRVSESKGGYLNYDPLPHINSIAELYYYAENFLSDITGDEDFGIISGDILKAFNGNIIGINSLGDEGGILPVYDPLVLQSFKNAIIVGKDYFPNTKLPNLEQDPATGNLLYDCKVYRSNSPIIPLMGSISEYIFADTADPDPATIVEVTRLHPAFEYGVEGDKPYLRIRATSELIVGASFTSFMANPESPFERRRVVETIRTNFTTTQSVKYERLSSLRYSPMLWNVAVNNTYLLSAFELLNDASNVARASSDVIARLNNVAIMSLLYVPGVAKTTF